ncbi:MAG TPA: fibronectin type III domain-containing protein, partial [Frankiaceae bacterium]|nr:fibronectin type III domain-containing protein [Frankiaceae bacterium]
MPNPVTPPGPSTFTVGNTGAVGAGLYSIALSGTASGSPGHSTPVDLTVVATTPAAPTLTAPADGSTNVSRTPAFTWAGGAGSVDYTIEVATDAGFGNIVASATGLLTGAWTCDVTLDGLTTYYWRVRAGNACGASADSATFSFTTVPLPGSCAPGAVPTVLYEYGFESDLNGWTTSGTGNTWAITTTASYVHSGTKAVHATDPVTVSDQRLVSPSIVLPSGQDPVVLEFWNYQWLQANGATGCFDG